MAFCLVEIIADQRMVSTNVEERILIAKGRPC